LGDRLKAGLKPRLYNICKAGLKTRLYTSLALGVIIVLPVAWDDAVRAAQEPDPESIAAGMRIFRTKGDCQACHGWAADGRKMDTQMPDGANLRTTKLTREKLLIAIKCGIPGKGMPAFDKFAYSDGRCYGMKQADLQKLGALPDPPATLQAREIDQVADFLSAKVVGKGPMDRAKCIEYWGSDVAACSEFPK
jgi:cbb3-type cytochrome c oxidase subunit III